MTCRPHSPSACCSPTALSTATAPTCSCITTADSPSTSLEKAPTNTDRLKHRLLQLKPTTTPLSRCRLSELPESPSNPVAHLIGDTSDPHHFEYSAVLTTRVPLLPERHGYMAQFSFAPVADSGDGAGLLAMSKCKFDPLCREAVPLPMRCQVSR